MSGRGGGTRVFFVVSSSSIGGAERIFLALLKDLFGRGVDVSVAYHGAGSLAAEFRRYSARAWQVNLDSVLNPRAVLQLSSIMKEARPDVVHTHLWNADVLGGLAARHAQVAAKVSTVYGPYHLPLEPPERCPLKRLALSRVFRSAYLQFDRIIALSGFIRNDLNGRAGIRVPLDAIEVVRPGLDPDARRSLEAAFEWKNRRPRGGLPSIINVANFFPVKGQDWLIRAMPRVLSRLPAARCIFVGEGPSRRDSMALATRLGVERSVEFKGGVADPTGLLAASDIFVLPSLSEGLGLALLEAATLALPTVASRVGGIPEVIEDGVSGLLVPPRDPVALGDAIISVLTDPLLGKRLGDAGRATVRRRFLSEEASDRALDLYGKLLGRRKPTT